MVYHDLLNPAKYYDTQLKSIYRENAEKLFDEIASKATIDINANRHTIKLLDKDKLALEHDTHKYNGFRTLQVFSVFFCVVSPFIGGGLLYGALDEKISLGLGLGLGIFFIINFIAMIIMLAIPIRRSLLTYQAKVSKLKSSVEKLTNEGWEQMASLNATYDWSAPSEIINRTTPLIQLDKYFDIQKFAYLKDKYGFDDDHNVDRSTLMILSGSIVGNPFLLYRKLNMEMYMHTYCGSITIYWTERVSDGKGGSHSVSRSETLTAYVTKPAPRYFENTELMYANDAAPNLKFSRHPQGGSGLDDKALNRKIKKGARYLKKKAEEAISDNDPSTNFTAMGNEKFEVLFNALDRNNEVEFRLLYTPIAQISTIYLLVKAKPFGDDFSLYKDGCINYVVSKHSQSFDYSTCPDNYTSYSYDLSKEMFVSYNCQFIQNLFFDLAPLLCVPLYQQHKPIEYIYNDNKFPNYTSYEDEILANSFNTNVFLPEHANTKQILKTRFVKKVGKSDVINVTSHAFEGIPHVTYVSVHGGDGCNHEVPVHWIEYAPVKKETLIAVKDVGSSKLGVQNKISSNVEFFNKFSDKYSYQRGLCALLLKAAYEDDLDKSIDDIFKE